MVRSQLEDWELVEELPALELAVSELVTNAIVHGRGQVEVVMADVDGCVRLEVRDEGMVGVHGPPCGPMMAKGGLGITARRGPVRYMGHPVRRWTHTCVDGTAHAGEGPMSSPPARLTVMRAFSHVCSLELELGSTVGDEEA